VLFGQFLPGLLDVGLKRPLQEAKG
jgi:hypothetical protein